MSVLVILCAVLLVVVYLLLPGESTLGERAPFWGVCFAHRGLHTEDKDVPENSMPAFTAAVDAGYGIELDIQLSKDGEVVVFHDDDLQRVCGVPGRVDAHSYEELRGFALLGTKQHMPLLSDVLDLVDEQVPLLIELKTGPHNKQLCENAWRVLRTYDGDFCVQSFDPRIVRWFRTHAPGILRGQLAAPGKDLASGAVGYAVSTLLCNFLGRPQFISYKVGPRPFTARFAERFAMRFAWTVRPGDDVKAIQAQNDAVIFEFFRPEPAFAALPDAPGWQEEALEKDAQIAGDDAEREQALDMLLAGLAPGAQPEQPDENKSEENAEDNAE